MANNNYKSKYSGPKIDEAVALSSLLLAAGNGWIKLQSSQNSLLI